METFTSGSASAWGCNSPGRLTQSVVPEKKTKSRAGKACATESQAPRPNLTEPGASPQQAAGRPTLTPSWPFVSYKASYAVRHEERNRFAVIPPASAAFADDDSQDCKYLRGE
jgi:hypothetical protein